MRRWLVRLILLALLGTAAFWGWRIFFPSPERVIRKHLTELAHAASINPNEAPLTKLAKTQKLVSFFADDARLVIDVPGRSIQTIQGRDDIQQAAMAARSVLNNLTVQFLDVLVTVAENKQSASANLTATANLPGERIPEVQELSFKFKKTDHDWLIERVETVKTLR